MTIIRKIHENDFQAGFGEYILSDETPDRYDDIIEATSWDLKNFSKNPIALFAHDSRFPIGKWRNLGVRNKQLRGFLELAPLGTSDRIDEIRRLAEANILRAVSVGFHAKESRRRENSDGRIFTKCELVETSLCAVGANPNALSVAKSLGNSSETMAMLFDDRGRRQAVLARARATLERLNKKVPVMQADLEARRQRGLIGDGDDPGWPAHSSWRGEDF